ncbi:MAG: hypothetical protein Q8L86_17830 [Vicinamibacterales bacterium]|nr:hypothetical protein [Vicinamibacterales bacterium]
MKNLTFGMLLIASLLAGGVAPAEAQAKPEVWRVAFDDSGDEFRRALLGTLELADGVLRFSSDNRTVRWSIALADVKQVGPSAGYGEDARAVLIESLSGERLYVALLDKHMLYASPKKALKVMESTLGLPSVRAARAATANRLANAAGDGQGDNKGGQ